jgi:DNA (cytosine-5)-methyltransferase 1
MLRIISEVRPRYAFSENPSEDAIIEAQADLAAAGYSTARIKLSASFLGAPHIRDRWWMVADSNNKSELGGQKYAKMEGQQKCRNGLWETDPREPRVVDGVANRMDRLKCIGNGQVPSVAAAAWGYLTGYWGNLADEPAKQAV